MSCKANRELFTDTTLLEAALRAAVVASGLTTVATEFYKFEGGGVTGSVVLAESHMNIHTWPERDYYLNLDISVCNYQCDNTEKAKKLFAEMEKLFQPLDHNFKIVKGYRDINQDKYTEYFTQDYGFFLNPSEILFHQKSEIQDISIYETKEFGRCLRIDNFYQTSEKDEFFYHESLVHPAMITHPHPKKVLVIGGGDGGTLKDVLKHNTVERAVMVEIDGTVAEISKQYLGKIHQGSFDDPRSELIIADGLKYVAETEERFDVIILDLTDPIGPAKALYTKEFYAKLQNIMTDDQGVLALHSEYAYVYPDVFGRIHTTLSEVFHQVEAGFSFVPLYGAVMSFAYCSKTLNPWDLSRKDVAARLKERGVKNLQYYNDEQHFGILSKPEYAKKVLEQDHEVIYQANIIDEFMDLYNQHRGENG